jgi:hypothetical protein
VTLRSRKHLRTWVRDSVKRSAFKRGKFLTQRRKENPSKRGSALRPLRLCARHLPPHHFLCNDSLREKHCQSYERLKMRFASYEPFGPSTYMSITSSPSPESLHFLTI